jgi:hypothetical protein
MTGCFKEQVMQTNGISGTNREIASDESAAIRENMRLAESRSPSLAVSRFLRPIDSVTFNDELDQPQEGGARSRSASRLRTDMADRGEGKCRTSINPSFGGERSMTGGRKSAAAN